MNKKARLLSARQQGLTLVEVLIAAFIMTVIGLISFQSINATVGSKEAVEDNLKKLARLDRAWLLLETDLRNAVLATRTQIYGPGSGGQIPPMVVDSNSTSGGYWLTILRGGHANPLNFPRSEVIRVGYRIDEDTLWRDVWYDLASVDEEQTISQKIIDGIEGIELRVLSDQAENLNAGPWLDNWPQETTGVKLPMALEVTVNFETYGEIKRLYAIVKGETSELVVNPNDSADNQDNNQNNDENSNTGDSSNNDDRET